MKVVYEKYPVQVVQKPEADYPDVIIDPTFDNSHMDAWHQDITYKNMLQVCKTCARYEDIDLTIMFVDSLSTFINHDFREIQRYYSDKRQNKRQKR